MRFDLIALTMMKYFRNVPPLSLKINEVYNEILNLWKIDVFSQNLNEVNEINLFLKDILN